MNGVVDRLAEVGALATRGIAGEVRADEWLLTALKMFFII